MRLQDWISVYGCLLICAFLVHVQWYGAAVWEFGIFLMLLAKYLKK